MNHDSETTIMHLMLDQKVSPTAKATHEKLKECCLISWKFLL